MSNSEPRLEVDLPVRVSGMGSDGRLFLRNIRACNISSDGAKLLGLDHPVEGSIIVVQFGNAKARFKVVWVKENGDVGIKVLKDQTCPWDAELTKAQKPADRDISNRQDRRHLARCKVCFQIDIRDASNPSGHLRASTTDVSGRGCYVETLLPLPLNTRLAVTFWVDSEAITTPAVVRTCDRGVGMGIEFTGLDKPTQLRLQALIESVETRTDAS